VVNCRIGFWFLDWAKKTPPPRDDAPKPNSILSTQSSQHPIFHGSLLSKYVVETAIVASNKAAISLGSKIPSSFPPENYGERIRQLGR